eukprot:1161740-Pelagomonas_calceolata.AAC.9
MMRADRNWCVISAEVLEPAEGSRRFIASQIGCPLERQKRAKVSEDTTRQSIDLMAQRLTYISRESSLAHHCHSDAAYLLV